MKKLYIASAIAAVMIICIGSFGVVGKAVAAVAATLVEVVLPAKPYSASSVQSGNNGFTIFGPGKGIFGITNITISNTSTSPVYVQVNVQDSCVQSEILTSYTVALFSVPASSTLVVPFPSPFVTNSFTLGPSTPALNKACIGVWNDGADVMVVGFSQP